MSTTPQAVERVASRRSPRRARTRGRREVGLPTDTSLPFFAYGLLRRSAPGFLMLRDVTDAAERGAVRGRLFVRDGLPLLAPSPDGKLVHGDVMTFRRGAEDEAYAVIGSFEPAIHYTWQTVPMAKGDPGVVNVLAGIDPTTGSVASDSNEWRPGPDFAFAEAMEEIAELMDRDGQTEFGADASLEVRRMFRLQMGYLLLWSLIERYAVLRFGAVDDIEVRIEKLGLVSDLDQSIAQVSRRLGADLPPVHDKRVSPVRWLDEEHHSLAYFREVRHHLVHRGKGMPDAERLRVCLAVLHAAFGTVLAADQLA
jgi:hypothetical protein